MDRIRRTPENKEREHPLEAFDARIDVIVDLVDSTENLSSFESIDDMVAIALSKISQVGQAAYQELTDLRKAREGISILSNENSNLQRENELLSNPDVLFQDRLHSTARHLRWMSKETRSLEGKSADYIASMLHATPFLSSTYQNIPAEKIEKIEYEPLFVSLTVNGKYLRDNGIFNQGEAITDTPFIIISSNSASPEQTFRHERVHKLLEGARDSHVEGEDRISRKLKNYEQAHADFERESEMNEESRFRAFISDPSLKDGLEQMDERARDKFEQTTRKSLRLVQSQQEQSLLRTKEAIINLKPATIVDMEHEEFLADVSNLDHKLSELGYVPDKKLMTLLHLEFSSAWRKLSNVRFLIDEWAKTSRSAKDPDISAHAKELPNAILKAYKQVTLDILNALVEADRHGEDALKRIKIAMMLLPPSKYRHLSRYLRYKYTGNKGTQSKL